MGEVFSIEVKELIAQSREVALSLGYDYISTVHLFLADCKINAACSIRKFAFVTEDDFQTFYISQKVGEPIIIAEELPLTVEAENTIRNAFKIWSHSNYFDKEIRPYHLFLAAALMSNTLFCSLFPQEDQLYEKLEQYYIEVGKIDKDKIYKSFWMKHGRKIQKWLSR
jgi:hypothetical protein